MPLCLPLRFVSFAAQMSGFCVEMSDLSDFAMSGFASFVRLTPAPFYTAFAGLPSPRCLIRQPATTLTLRNKTQCLMLFV